MGKSQKDRSFWNTIQFNYFFVCAISLFVDARENGSAILLDLGALN